MDKRSSEKYPYKSADGSWKDYVERSQKNLPHQASEKIKKQIAGSSQILKQQVAQIQLSEHLQKKLEIATFQKQARKKDWQKANNEYEVAKKQLGSAKQDNQRTNKLMKQTSFDNPIYNIIFETSKKFQKDVEHAMQLSKRALNEKKQMKIALDLAEASLDQAEKQIRIFKQNKKNIFVISRRNPPTH